MWSPRRVWSWLGVLIFAVACREPATPAATSSGSAGPGPAATELVVYSGRSEALIKPLLDRFEAHSGVKLKVRYAETAALATLLLEEGARSPAAVFLAQDVGAVGALGQKGLLAPMPADVLERVPAAYRGKGGTWVGVTGRVRTIAYAPSRTPVESLPASVFDLVAPTWKGKVGWAPQNASFQVFVTGMRKLAGDDATGQWLSAMKANGTKEFPKNGAIVQAVAAGEIDLGLVNHYYLYQFKKDDPAFPVANHLTKPGDPGSLVNLSTVAVLASAPTAAAARAHELARFLLSDPIQAAFATETREYPLVAGGPAPEGMPALADLSPPQLDLGDLGDLEGTVALLQRSGVLP